MIKGIFSSASGMIPRVRKQELIANNVANVKTTGFKKDLTFTRELRQAERKLAPHRSDWQQPLAQDLYVDYTAVSYTHLRAHET